MVWTPQHRLANDLVGGWMRAAGLAVRDDAAGNVVGRIEGLDPDAPALLVGSHLDSVRDAGSWDGPLGVVAAISSVEGLRRGGWQPRRPVEIVGFCDEEGTRFGAAMLGSQALAGRFDPALLALKDADGVTMADAMRQWGLDPARIGDAARAPGSVAAYLELHMEQGPVLERLGLPVGVVSAISGQTRWLVTLTGEAGHAGTVPMAGRRDALAAASACVLAIEQFAAAEPGAVATVGWIEVPGGATNTIPGRTVFSLDVRAPDDEQRAHLLHTIGDGLSAICAARGMSVDFAATHALAAAPCDPDLRRRIAAAIAAEGYALHEQPSGAGHDGMALRGLCGIGMIFVRCAGGISHNPAEHVSEADAEAGARVLTRVIEDIA